MGDYQTWLWTKRDDRLRLFTPEEDRRFARRAARRGRLLILSARLRRVRTAAVSFLRRPLGRLRRPRPIVWEEDYGGTCPCCPACHEPAYSWQACVFCGQRFKSVER